MNKPSRRSRPALRDRVLIGKSFANHGRPLGVIKRCWSRGIRSDDLAFQGGAPSRPS